jgi:CheY-like chemotaxis protein/DNA-directed RNA polymerase subunit RPC12/RpoP
MNCPRCKTPIGPLSDPDSIITCPGCGSRLMTRAAARRSQGGPKGAGAEPAPAPPAPPAPPPPSFPSPSDTIRPTHASILGTRPGEAFAPAPVGADTTRRRRSEAKAKAEAEGALDLVLKELQALRDTQERILRAVDDLRRASRSAPPAGGAGLAGGDEPGFWPIRDGRRKSIVLVDDDPQTREAAAAELRRAEIPVRTYADGSAALSGIAEEKPDVIVLELGVGGDMGGKDLVNMIKATMEWVDIPIVLWTREAISSQKEARQIHGADEVVPKSGGPAALVARVINVFRR